MKTKIMKYKLRCQRCGWEWIPRKEDVRQCPKCRNLYWDMPREGIKNDQG
jgi:predicted Zn-ribbon and HTH transcriptional regulator